VLSGKTSGATCEVNMHLFFKQQCEREDFVVVVGCYVGSQVPTYISTD
jgi:hypothetical protein